MDAVNRITNDNSRKKTVQRCCVSSIERKSIEENAPAKVMVYSHDTYGLGNIRRMLAIAEHIASSHPQSQVLVVTGSPMQHGFRVSKSIDFIKLPCLSRDDVGRYRPRGKSMTTESLVAMRSEMLCVAYRHFNPDVLLVDKKPLGVKKELNSLFEEMGATEVRPVVALVLRDILDAPFVTQQIWKRNAYHQVIAEHYDLVLVAGQPEVFDVVHEYNFPVSTRKKLRFCGYIKAHQGVPSVPGCGMPVSQPHVLVTVGGGGDGARVIHELIQGMRQCQPDRVGFSAKVIMGPEMEAEQCQELKSMADEVAGLEITEFCADMAAEIASADLVVGMCGYNTSCEALSAGKPFVTIPRVKPVQEQLIRARHLADLKLATMLHPDDLCASTLMKAIERALRVPCNPSLRSLDFNGLDRIGYWLNAEYERLMTEQAQKCCRVAMQGGGPNA